nr:YkyA family protein [Halobacillus andaensis]
MALLAAATFLMVACSSQSPEEQMYEHMEEAVSLEENFREQQEPLQELEQEEEEIYNQIIEMDSEDMENIQELSAEAGSIVEERKERIDTEKESIDEAKEEFDEVKSLVDELESEEAQDKANELIDTMDNRYEAYQDLYDAYQTALGLDSELYEMMQEEDLTKEDLQSKVDEINDSYNEVIEANEVFNQYTTDYNEMKKEFYDAAELDVNYEEAE